TGFIDFLISFSLLIVMMTWFRFWPDWRVLMLPLFIGMAFVAALGPALLLAALNVEYRDFRYVIPFLVQFGLYLSPVGYSSSLVRERFGDTAFAMYSFNPMVGVIDGFRWCLLGGEARFCWPSFALALAVVVAMLVTGVWYFRRTERTFADVI